MIEDYKFCPIEMIRGVAMSKEGVIEQLSIGRQTV